jgi:hypothetical protein
LRRSIRNGVRASGVDEQTKMEVPDMSDYRNPNDPLYRDDPLSREARYESARSYNAAWGWIAGALFLVIILAVAFSVGREPSQTAMNETSPPATSGTTGMAPPAANPGPVRPAPAPTPPANPAAR